MQDVIFQADLDPYVGDRRASLLYTQPPEGVTIFQPLDGRRRWRCQVSVRRDVLHICGLLLSGAATSAHRGAIDQRLAEIEAMPTPDLHTMTSYSTS